MGVNYDHFDAPYFSARQLADDDCEFWCVPCGRFHVHSAVPGDFDAYDDGLRVARCPAHSPFEDGYFLRVVGSYDDDAFTKRDIKRINKSEFEWWTERRRNYEERARAEATRSMSATKERSMSAIVKFYKDGESMSVSTNAKTEEEFLAEAIRQLSEKIEAREFGPDAADWEFQLERWIPQIIEIVNKLRGYKANVHEEHLITAGYHVPAEVVRAFAKVV